MLLLSVCLSCVGQSTSPDLAKKIERQVRSRYTIPPDVRVLAGTPSPSAEFPAYDSVVVTLDAQNSKEDLKFLVSKDGRSMKQLIDFDLSKDPFAETMSKIDLSARPSRGAKESKVTAVIFNDFECPFCARLHQILFPGILKEYGDRVTFIYKDYPLTTIHPWAMHAAVDANCLAAQNTDAYWDFADYIHANQREVNDEKTPVARTDALDRIVLLQAQKHGLDVAKLQSCIQAQDESNVKASMKQGESVGVKATPDLFVNGEEIPGSAGGAGAVRAALDRALRDAGLPVPEHALAVKAPVPSK